MFLVQLVTHTPTDYTNGYAFREKFGHRCTIGCRVTIPGFRQVSEISEKSVKKISVSEVSEVSEKSVNFLEMCDFGCFWHSKSKNFWRLASLAAFSIHFDLI